MIFIFVGWWYAGWLPKYWGDFLPGMKKGVLQCVKKGCVYMCVWACSEGTFEPQKSVSTLSEDF